MGSSIFDWLGDALVPKEIAPYLGILAPMVAPQLGIVGSLAMSQLGSFKQNEGDFDPYSALATGIALSSPHARDIRARGRLDPSRGTIGQRMSAGLASNLPGDGGGGLYRALDPRLSIRKNEFGNWFENPYVAANESPLAASGLHLGHKDALARYDNQGLSDATFDRAWEGTKDMKYGKKATLGDDFTAAQEGTDDIKSHKTITDSEGNVTKEDIFTPGKDAVEASFGTNTNLTAEQQEAYLEIFDDKKLSWDEKQIKADRFLKDLPRVGGDMRWYETAADYGSELAGAVMPGFSQYDDKGYRIPETFDLAKAVTTISVASTLGSVMALKNEIEEEKLKDEEEEREVWSEWFKSYERTAGHTYEFSPYREQHLWDIYQKYMMANGGRVGYNVGGGVMEAPGIPQGMQLDGRGGAFISQGIEERADDVPAMLSKNEFVLTADAMKGLDKMMGGSGDPRSAAKYMYQTMDQLEAMA